MKITKEKITLDENHYERTKKITLIVEGRTFEITRDYTEYDAECNDYDDLEFYDEFTDDEKIDINNLLSNGDFEEWLEW